MSSITLEWLHSIEALQAVPDSQLQWFIDNSEHRTIEEGGYLFKTGERIPGTAIIFKGRVKIFVVNNYITREVGYFEEKDITGYLPFSRGLVAAVSGEVVSELQFLFFPIEKMNELITSHFELTQALVHVMTTRVREFTVRQQQNEKMMALGKLSAGLAHELNNPSSAILRASASLKTHLRMQCESIDGLLQLQLSVEQGGLINEIYLISSAVK